MIARLRSVEFTGIEATPVEVEVDVARRGFAGTTLVGGGAIPKAGEMSLPNLLFDRVVFNAQARRYSWRSSRR